MGVTSSIMKRSDCVYAINVMAW